MVREDWPTTAALSREQRIAAEVVRRFGLAPPVNIGSVVANFAECEEDAIPGECDGLVVGLHGPRSRPLILLDRGHAEVRRRFTLAHELGHILLPWHTGDAFLCETGRVRPPDDYGDAVDPEREANRFAAELLVPSKWLQACVASLGIAELTPLMDAIEDARVSAYVACLRLLTVLPAGYAFAITQGGTVQMSGQTRGTGVLPQVPTEDLDRARLNQWAHVVEEMRYGPAQVTWWTYRGEATVSEHVADPRSWREVLDGLLDRHAPTEPDRGRIQRSLNGAIAAAHGVAKQEGNADVAALYVRFRGRFAKSRSLPEGLLADPEFDLLLHKRAEEFGRR